MNTTYELWDIETGNVVGSFARREDALGVVATLLRSFGSAYAYDLTLGRRDGAGVPQTVATGDDLLGTLAGEEPEPVRGVRATASS